MEELIYILPFNLYGIEITVTILIIALVLFSIILRLLKVPQKLMVIATGALAMVAYMAFQTEGPGPVQPLINLAQRQNQLDRQFEKAPINLGDVKITHVKVRAHTLTLTIESNAPLPDTATKEEVEARANSYLTENLALYCKMLKLEQDLPYRKTNQQYFDLTFHSYYVKFVSGDKSAHMEIPLASCPNKPTENQNTGK